MSPVQPPSVTVVIPVRNGAGSIRRAIDALFAQDYEGPMEIIVAEGGSTDDTRTVLERLGGEIKVIDNPSGHTPDAMNAGIAASSGDIIVRCDAQSVLPPGYVSQAVSTLLETGAANVGGIQHPEGSTIWERAVAAAQSTPLGVGDAKYRLGGAPGPVDTVYLGVFRRDALERVGGYDRRFQRNQDYELNYRLRQAGEVVWFDPGLVVAYTPRSSLKALARQYFDYGRWKRHMVKLHPKSIRARQLAAPTLLTALAASAAVAPWSRAIASVVPLTYGSAVVATAVVESIRRRDPAMLLTAAAIPTMHGSWAVGFFLGHPEMRS